jgi:hypothetical protein
MVAWVRANYGNTVIINGALKQSYRDPPLQGGVGSHGQAVGGERGVSFIDFFGRRLDHEVPALIGERPVLRC